MAGSRPAGWLAVASCLLAVLAWRGQAAKCWYHRSRDQYSNCIQLDNNLVLYWSVVDNTTLRLAPDVCTPLQPDNDRAVAPRGDSS